MSPPKAQVQLPLGWLLPIWYPIIGAAIFAGLNSIIYFLLNQIEPLGPVVEGYEYSGYVIFY
jgi:hypothetical protein